MKTVLNVCRDDWANFAHDNARALQAVGVDATAVKLNDHAFGYDSTAKVMTHAEIQERIREADVVQLFHSDTTFLALCKDLGKHTIVYHAGSAYRENYKELNRQFNPVVKRTVCALGELMKLGASRPVYIVGAIDTGDQPEILQPRPYVFGHFPSNPQVKGTQRIAEMMAATQCTPDMAQYRYSTRLIGNEQQRKRMQDCHVYIELHQPTLKGKPYGSFGITALEAAAMGKAVVTMNLTQDIYRKHYGDCALLIANSEKEFITTVVRTIFSAPETLLVQRNNTRQWVVEKHSYVATGQYILKHIMP